MIEYRMLDPTEANRRIPELQEVYRVVFSSPPYSEGPEMVDKFAEWIAEESRNSGFQMNVALRGEKIVGFAYGYVQSAGDWWRGTDRPVSKEVKAADRFAVMEWAVIPEVRGHGIGKQLMENLLAARVEPYATLTVNPAADARTIYERWGWRHVASTKPGKMPGMDVMLKEL
jgi:ribosomal protein S18 acetylase RimI-like enzyme